MARRGGTPSASVSPFASHDGTRIAYRVCGDGPMNVVFLHAWGASGRYFDETVDNLDLSATRAITVDIRGHGDSDKPDEALSWDVLAGDVFAVTDAVGAERFVAVGHSMGGKLAQYLPLVEPERVQGLVLVASPSAGRLPSPDFVGNWVQHAGDGKALVDASVRPFLRNAVSDDVLERFAREAAKIPRMYLERTLDLVSTTSFIERLGSVTIPVLVISSDADPVHSTEHDLVRSLPEARREVLEAGTEIPMEQPVAFAHMVERFLQDIH